MNLTQLQSLIAVSEAGSFTAAADKLGVTQSGVSQALAALEESLGVKLLIRQPRGVELTAFGERALEHARTALSHLEAIEREAMALIGEETGAIRLAGFPSVFATVLPPLLRRFRTLHPGIDLVPLETDDLEVEAWLAAGSIDLGVVLNPSPARKAVPLGRDAWVPILPAAHPLSRRTSVSLAELAAAPFVLATGGCHTNARSLADAAGLTLQNVQIEVRDWSSAIALVREGAGVSLVPESTLPEQHRGFRVSKLASPLHREFGLVASQVRPLSRAGNLFVEVARRSTAPTSA
ncbi:LysR family transcriptional regulator [Oryzibacter oryziterrae]|uniref:LysR family transcriptional regulator n=1 Tax=Oryzibacter oryziterrae TaxID=2766474 RepID=UPI001F25A3A0|nr:LysR family transcriptional regulator [Oryzibacter oryziterrae]